MNLLIVALVSFASHADSPAVGRIRSDFDRCSNEWAQVTKELFLCTMTAAKRMEALLDTRYQRLLGDLPPRQVEALAVEQTEWESRRDRLCEYVKLDDEGRYDFGLVRRVRCRYHAALKRVQQLENPF